MQVHHVRRHLEQMVVQRRDAQPSLEQAGHDRVDLRIEQHEVAHHHRRAARRDEGGVGAQGERRLERHALHGDVQIRARQGHAEHPAWHHLPRRAERTLDRLLVNGSLLPQDGLLLGPGHGRVRVQSHERRGHAPAHRERTPPSHCAIRYGHRVPPSSEKPNS
jgi:hypothetical protein